MIIVLWIVAAIALVNGAMGMPDVLLIASSNKATVFQQISARMDVGLSLLVFATSSGLAAVLSRLHERSKHDEKLALTLDSALDAFGKAAALLPTKTANSAPHGAPPKPAGAGQDLKAAAGMTQEEIAARDAAAGGVVLSSGFVIRERPAGDDMDAAAKALYGKPPSLRGDG